MFLWKYEFTSTSINVLQLPDSDSKIVEAGDNYIQNIFDSEKTTVENKTLSTKFRPICQKISLLTHKRKRDIPSRLPVCNLLHIFFYFFFAVKKKNLN